VPRVKLPKTFLAVNLSDAFTFQEKERQNSEADVLEMKNLEHTTKSSVTTPVNDEQPAPEVPGGSPAIEDAETQAAAFTIPEKTQT
jgi:hypothetical protein